MESLRPSGSSRRDGRHPAPWAAARAFRALLALAAALWAGPACLATGPFAVVPSVATNGGRACLQLEFRIPEAHLLYAEKLEFRLDGTTNRVPFRVPRAVPARDRFSGQTKQVYATTFMADWVLPRRRPATLRVRVTLQGCNQTSCFFPETRRFEVDALGRVREVEADPEPPAQSASSGPSPAPAPPPASARYLDDLPECHRRTPPPEAAWTGGTR